MSYTVIKPFSLSHDGIRSVTLAAGDRPDVPADLVQGLVDAGYIRAASAEATQADVEGVTIPSGWRDLHHTKLIALAKGFDPHVTNKSEAISVIEAAEKASAEATQG